MDISEKQAAGHLPGLDQRRHRLITQYLERRVDEPVVQERLTLICQRFAGARSRSYRPVLVERALKGEREAA